jgi:hypothetical protein
VETLRYKPHNGIAPHHKGQTRLHEARAKGAKRIVAHVGRRWGKTRLGIGDLATCYQTVLGMKRSLDIVPPFHSWIVVPNYPQGRQIWHELLTLWPKAWRGETKTSEHMMYLKDLSGNWQGRDGLIEMRSAFDAESLVGTQADHLWINEAQDIPDEAFEMALPVTRSPEVLGWQYFEGIPPTYPDHWFYRTFMEAKDNPDNFAFQATTFDNPLLTDEHRKEIESDREVLSAISWERLYLALYSANAGFFRGIDSCLSGDILHGPIPGKKYVAGLDIGWTNDPSVLILMDMSERRIVQHWEWDGSFTWADTREHIRAIHADWDLQNLVFDASSAGGKAVEEDLLNTDLPAEPFNIVGAYRKQMLERLAGAIDRGTMSFPPTIKPLIRQLRAMQMRRQSTSGVYRLEVPRGEHDDYIFAAALAIMSCDEPWAPVSTVPRVGRNTRYVQTQAEANGQALPDGRGASLMRERKLAGIRQRAIIAGVESR